MKTEYRRKRAPVCVLDSPGVLLYRLEESPLERADPVLFRHVRVLVHGGVLLFAEPDDVAHPLPLTLDIGAGPVGGNPVNYLRKPVLTDGRKKDPVRNNGFSCAEIEPRKRGCRARDRHIHFRLVYAAVPPKVLPVELLIGKIDEEIIEHHLPPLFHVGVFRKIRKEGHRDRVLGEIMGRIEFTLPDRRGDLHPVDQVILCVCSVLFRAFPVVPF